MPPSRAGARILLMLLTLLSRPARDLLRCTSGPVPTERFVLSSLIHIADQFLVSTQDSYPHKLARLSFHFSALLAIFYKRHPEPEPRILLMLPTLLAATGEGSA